LSKTIDTLVEDIYEVVKGNGGWDATVSQFFKEELDDALKSRFNRPKPTSGAPFKGTLRMSNIGTQCRRKLWYSVNVPVTQQQFGGAKLLSFLYGDILEVLLISLAKAAGHEVWGEQDEFIVDGIKGHRDCVIDGVTIDIKTASNYSFKNKFLVGLTEDKDDFGYLSQLSSYVYADQDPRVSDTEGAFLVIDKSTGELVLDRHDLSDYVKDKLNEFQYVRGMTQSNLPPNRVYTDNPEGKAGNRVLSPPCSFCEYKETCWGNLRVFDYFNGPKYFTKVTKLPKVPEIT